MINFNGNIIEKESVSVLIDSRGFKYGDALFETMKVVNSKILFWEDHYFRLMASMRILRMEIPMSFTMEFLEKEIFKIINTNNSYKVRLYVSRIGDGLYLSNTNNVSYVITFEAIEPKTYVFNASKYKVDLYKDYNIAPGLLATLKTNNKVLNVIASIYAKENKLDNCLLLNTNKSVVESINSNIFLVIGNTIKTPPLTDGCLKGVMRKQVIDVIKSFEGYKLMEASISPFELQKADELFLTNVISGIQPIKTYRKKTYNTVIAKKIVDEINKKIS